jgi:hypothetical protein
MPFENSSFQDVNNDGVVVIQLGTNGTLGFDTAIKKHGSQSLSLTNSAAGGVARSLRIPLAAATSTWTAGFWFYGTNPRQNQVLLSAPDRTKASPLYDQLFPEEYQGSSILLTATNVPGNQTWHHVAITCTGSLVSLYIDGALKGSFATTATFANVNALSLSSNGSTTYHFWGAHGYFDDFKFYHNALFAGEILTMMEAVQGAGGGLGTNAILTSNNTQAPDGGVWSVLNLFDNSVLENNHGYATSGNPPNLPVWVRAEFPVPITVRRYRIWATAVGALPWPEYGPKDFTLQGSNDGTFATFATLDTRSNIALPATNGALTASQQPNACFSAQIANPGAYKFYRLHVTSLNRPSSWLIMGEWQLSTA